jgi:hypothetical protein
VYNDWRIAFMKLRLRYFAVCLCLLGAACVNHDFDQQTAADSFVFGRYYGYCAGDCYNVFVLKDNSLFQSEDEAYPATNGPWSLPSLRALTDDKKNLAADLPALLPQALLNSDKNVIGCPDCGDFGGLYIELNQNGQNRFWYIDNATQDQELKDFIAIVHDRITALVQK